MLLPRRERVQSGGGRPEAPPRARAPARRAGRSSWADPARRSRAVGAQLERGAVRLGARVRRELSGQPRDHRVGVRGQRPVGGVEQHHLLLDPDGPRPTPRAPIAPTAPCGRPAAGVELRGVWRLSPAVAGSESPRLFAGALLAAEPAASTRRSNRASCSASPTSVSACHWTPSTKRPSCPSLDGLDQAVLGPRDGRRSAPAGRSPGGERS